MQVKPFDYLLLKIAMRCNIDCTYCYWFRDASVFAKPKTLTENAQAALLEKLEAHVVSHALREFSILLHGGEPLLFGKARFILLCQQLESLHARTNCVVHLSMTTNGLLLDAEWIKILLEFKVDVTVSIDGPKEIHDRRRIDFKGRGTFDGVEASIKRLLQAGKVPGVLSVCDPESNPKDIVQYLVEQLGIKKFDVLVPDCTREDRPIPIADYFIKLFDLWFDDYGRRGVDIRYLRSMVKGLLGGVSKVESIGYGPINTVCMLTDGSLEPLDVIRIAGNEATKTDLNIFENTFEDLKKCALWADAYASSLQPCAECRKCEYIQACGGGFLPHRYSTDRGFDNPSVYCEDLKVIFKHIWSRIAPQIHVVALNGELAQRLSSVED